VVDRVHRRERLDRAGMRGKIQEGLAKERECDQGLSSQSDFALSHFRTFALSHLRTFALSHFRTFASFSPIGTTGDDVLGRASITVLVSARMARLKHVLENHR
jgi:hypothetical protein